MGLIIELDLATLEWAIEEGTIKSPTPGGEEVSVRVKVAVFGDAQTGIRIRVPLPVDMPPDTSQLPPNWKPPAIMVAEGLLDNKPRIDVATTMPPFPPTPPKR